MRKIRIIFSTASRFITFAPHCVSWMFNRKSSCTTVWKPPAGESPVAGLRLMNDRIRQPARATTQSASPMCRTKSRNAHAASPRRHPRNRSNRRRGELESFDERAALANRLLEFQHPKRRRKFRRDATTTPSGDVRAAVEHGD